MEILSQNPGSDFSGSFSFEFIERGLKPEDSKKVRELLLKW